MASLATSVTEIDLELDLTDERLPEHIEVALYRIAQEAVQNVVKHSRALTARLSFAVRDGVARLEIIDAGAGFDPGGTRSGGFGMLSMAERAELVGGRVSVRSRPGEGTTVAVAVPIGEILE